ncbi:MAG: aldo/keto reductase [Desulfurococcales archaeon]|nr:aldo/keto reductase [Desulfurococcales archaeon]
MAISMKMEYTTLGTTGVKISRIGLGAWQFSQAWGVTEYSTAREIISRALELGVNLIDTAMVYGRGLSEEFIGKALRELDVKRDDVVIATKIPGEFLAYDDVFKAVDKSLKRLQVDYIDLMQVHWPPCWHNHPTCEYMRALERLVVIGKINYIGLSDFPVELVDAARACLSRSDVEVLQVRYNIVERQAEKELIPYAEENGMTLLAWSPLAKGAILGKYSLEEAEQLEDVRRDDPLFKKENYQQILRVAEILKELGEKYDKTPAQVALNWLIGYSDIIVPIPGAKNPQQVEDNVKAVGWRLSYDDWRRLDEATKSLRITYVTW